MSEKASVKGVGSLICTIETLLSVSTEQSRFPPKTDKAEEANVGNDPNSPATSKREMSISDLKRAERSETKKVPGPTHLAEVDKVARSLRSKDHPATVGNISIENPDLDLPDVAHSLRFLHDHLGWKVDGHGGYLMPEEVAE